MGRLEEKEREEEGRSLYFLLNFYKPKTAPKIKPINFLNVILITLFKTLKREDKQMIKPSNSFSLQGERADSPRLLNCLESRKMIKNLLTDTIKFSRKETSL